MGSNLIINENYIGLFEKNGLSSIDSFLNFCSGNLVDSNSKRCVYRFSLLDKQQNMKRVFYLKIFTGSSFNNYVSAIFNFGKPKSQAKIEWDNSVWLRKSGFRSAPLAAFGEKTLFGFERSSFFLTEEIPDSVSLDIFFENTQIDLRRKENILSNLADEVNKLHKCGFCYPDLYLKHIFIDTKQLDKNEVIFTFIDLHRLLKKKKVSSYDRIRDLSALFFSCRALLSDKDNEFWLKSYLKSEKNCAKFIEVINKRVSKISLRRSSYKGILTRKIINETGKLYVNENFYDLFNANKINDFGSLFAYCTDTGKFTDNPGRTVQRFRLVYGRDELVFYIKKHTCEKKSAYIYNKLRDNAKTEWKNHLLCAKLSIPVPVPVAWGFCEGRSVFVTQELKNSVSLEYILRNNLLPADFETRSQMIQNTALLAKKLHEKDYCHKDFYAGHILIQPYSCDNLRNCIFYLIDLQRISKCSFFKTRWKIKDLAQLNFTTSYPCVTTKDRIKFLYCYFGVSKLTKKQRAFLNSVQAKTNRIRNHIPKVLRRKNIFSWDQVK